MYAFLKPATTIQHYTSLITNNKTIISIQPLCFRVLGQHLPHLSSSNSLITTSLRPPYTILDLPCRPLSHPPLCPLNIALNLGTSRCHWKDPQRRRGVNELDLWEQKQQQRRATMVTDQHVDLVPTSSTYSTHDRIQPVYTPFPFIQQDTTTSKDDDDDNDDNDSGTTTADNGQDRPWQRYVQSSSRPIDLSALNEEEEDDQHSLHSSSTILHPSPIYNLNQE
ncbi:unnamed protein product [Absidia cylindrospora]